MPAPVVEPEARLRRCLQLALVGWALLLGAALRHNLVWGESAARPWQLPLLNAIEAGGLLGFTVLCGVAWWRALAVVRNAGVDAARLRRMTFLLLAAAVAVPLLSTTDPIDYVMRGRILALHGGNPYLDVATDFPDDPFVGFGDSGWKDMPLPYGPIVANLQGLVAWLAHLLPFGARVELVVALLLFKLLFAYALWTSAGWLAATAERLRPGARDAAFVAVMWNPMLLFEGVANAHNEPLVLLCLAGAVAAATASRFGMSVFALGCGVMSKVVPALMLPAVAAMALRRRELPRLALGAVATAIVALLFYWQLFSAPGAFDVWDRQGDLVGGSFWWVVHEATGVELRALVAIGRVGVLAWAGWCCVRILQRPEPRELVFAFASSLLLLAVFGAGLFGTWYHVWWLPFGLLLGGGYLYRVAVVASVTSPAAYLIWCGMRRLDDPAQWWGVSVAVFAPLLLGVLPARRAAISA